MRRRGFQGGIFELGLEHGFEPSIATHAEGISPPTSGFEAGRPIVGGQGLHAFEAAKCLFFIGFLGEQGLDLTQRLWTVLRRPDEKLWFGLMLVSPIGYSCQNQN